MKTPKKLWMGIVTLAAAVFFGLLIPTVYAEPFKDQAEWRSASYTLVSKSKIIANFPGHPPVNFTDTKPGDATHNYVADTNNTGVCEDSDSSITLSGSNPFNSRPAKGSLKVRLEIAGAAIPCPDGIKFEDSSISVKNNLEPDGSNADTGPAKITYNGQTYTQIDQGANARVYGLKTGVNDCYGGGLIVLDEVASKANAPVDGTAINIRLSGPGGGEEIKAHAPKIPVGFPVAVASLGKCVYDTNGLDALVSVTNAGIATFKSCPAGSPSCGEPSVEDDTSACVFNSNTGLEWLLCPITTGISKAADGMNRLIQHQLYFDVKGNLANADQVHTAWSIIKNIVSVAIVIILLVMVISQAVGGGPFDAYTIKKLLPKLVIAVIAMQISWDLCKWFISLANDAGVGIQQLLTAPFGGGGDLDLNSILHRLDDKWALGSQLLLPALLTGGVIVAFIALPGALVAAFGLFIGVFAALMVLLFRNVLIVALTIFSPLAFLAWTLPGTQNIWKLWRENFTKLLLMFPLIIAMVYAGRIFAWIIADAGTPGFIDYMTVLIAFFGPYYFVFKSYKWGGGLLGAAGAGIAGARRGLTQANAPWLKTLGERAQGNIANRYIQAQEKQRKSYEAVGTTDDRISNLKKRIADRKARGLNTDAPERRLAALQGKRQLQQDSAMQAMKENGKWQRAMWRIGSGKPLPSSRQQLETIARGAQYKKELVDQKQALIHNDYVEQLNSGSSVSDAKKYIRDKYGHGNMEQNAAGDWSSKDVFTERAFYNWLVDTKSAMELGDTDWRTRGGTMPDVGKTKGFIGMMNADPQRYAYIAQALPELQPFNQALGGGPKTEDFLVGGKSFAALERSDPATAAKIRAGGAAGQELAEALADDSRYAKIFTNLEHTSDIAVWRPEQLQMMADNIKKLKDSGVSTSQAENELTQILSELESSPTPEAKSTLQRLMGGKKSARKAVNDVMGDRWLEDSLNVPVEAAGVDRVIAAPREKELADAEFRTKYIDRLLIPSVGKAINKDREEFTQTLAGIPEYSEEAHGVPQSSFYREFLKTADAVKKSNNTETIERWNKLINEAQSKVRAHAQRMIQNAAAQGLPAADQERIANEETAKALGKLRMFERRKVPPPAPGTDPTEIIIPHTP